ncbi:hypothetical protein COY26_02220 [Candidatus Woesearchaeota archaeon CG_4_10_14_0_2_um_filter_33_10]|nr:MAG: hypothetical protein COV14_01360 [Candidatus Woesearchaeota archaeon CG10_big_fil_rev_8_21_14_0_10_33_12]PIU72513.1 MAG: hypothetical protein COS79_02540 [Candidatus Woesearchaeota archaeon CG06_land_8_20_14_3_00_33_13]PIZ53352.1 MAG: hypothetical protein COY26_02220 [Candidatus Woesearchaeota archaeon CG_4_10_14_0_2_um_filter_33_10]
MLKSNHIVKKLDIRFFNSMKIDYIKETLTKSTLHDEKLNSEIDWYLSFPSHFRRYFPKIFDYRKGYNPYIKMEFYNYPSLADIYLNDKLPLDQWKKIFLDLHEIVKKFQSANKKITEKEKFESLLSMYYKKTIKRLKQLEMQNSWNKILSNPIYINGKKYFKDKIKKDLKDCLHKYLLNLPKRDFCLIHGDLCAGNILFDKSNFIFVDPRGKFGKFVIYGDTYYDIAKLSHSFLGFYDLIVDSKYKLDFNDNHINYEILASDKQNKISEAFKEEILFKYDYKEVRLIESLLFLSMLPLHVDDFKRQIVLFSRGLELFYSVKDGGYY